MVVVGHVAVAVLEQVEGDLLRPSAPVPAPVPVLDVPEELDQLALDAGFLTHLARGGLLQRLAVVGVALGQRERAPARGARLAWDDDDHLVATDDDAAGRDVEVKRHSA